MTSSIPKAPPAGRSGFDLPDTLLAVFLIASCGYFIYLSSQFPDPPNFLGDNVLPGHFPRLMLYTIGILSLLVPFEHKFSPDRWPSIQKARSAPIGWDTGVTALFIGVIVVLGPVIGTVLMVLGTSLLMPILWGERRWLLLVIYSLVFTALITWVFSIVLSVYFEPGIFNITLR